MIKLSHGDILAVLKQFKEANSEAAVRHINQVQALIKTPVSLVVSFQFKKRRYVLLIDASINNSERNVQQHIVETGQKPKGELLHSPDDETRFGLSFKGREVYIFKTASRKLRLDTCLAELYPDTSRSTWQKHIKAGHVSVNDRIITVPKAEIDETDAIAITLPVANDTSQEELPIIYLDDNVIVINKPTGVLTHSKGALNDEFTVADFFRRYTTHGLETSRPGIVHRLDRDTSGILIGARNPETAQLLQRQFADRTVKKTYSAIIDGAPKSPHAVIDLPIGRNPTAPSMFRVDPKGKAAKTTYRVLKSKGKHSLIELRPQTGRTHQLRVHMSYLGTPITGDRVYGKAAKRLYLHATSLEITIPDGFRKVFSAPVPDDFSSLIEET